jgi:hypothetical protein
MKVFKGWFGDQPDNFTGIVETPRGNKYWYLNGERHRVGGPASEYPGGSKRWYLNGLRHRVDGPASEWADGTEIWYLNDVEMTEDEHTKRTACYRTTLGRLILKKEGHFKLQTEEESV